MDFYLSTYSVVIPAYEPESRAKGDFQGEVRDFCFRRNDKNNGSKQLPTVPDGHQQERNGSKRNQTRLKQDGAGTK